jgi:predicted nucleic acid-binding protein
MRGGLNDLRDRQNLNLTTDAINGSDYSTTLFALAREYNLTCYDAAYLELAIRTQAIVRTLDGDLKEPVKQYEETGLKILW